MCIKEWRDLVLFIVVIFETVSKVRLKKHKVEMNRSLWDQNQSIKCTLTSLRYHWESIGQL